MGVARGAISVVCVVASCGILSARTGRIPWPAHDGKATTTVSRRRVAPVAQRPRHPWWSNRSVIFARETPPLHHRTLPRTFQGKQAYPMPLLSPQRRAQQGAGRASMPVERCVWILKVPIVRKVSPLCCEPCPRMLSQCTCMRITRVPIPMRLADSRQNLTRCTVLPLPSLPYNAHAML
jgi:hypothetical protein